MASFTSGSSRLAIWTSCLIALLLFPMSLAVDSIKEAIEEPESGSSIGRPLPEVFPIFAPCLVSGCFASYSALRLASCSLHTPRRQVYDRSDLRLLGEELDENPSALDVARIDSRLDGGPQGFVGVARFRFGR